MGVGGVSGRGSWGVDLRINCLFAAEFYKTIKEVKPNNGFKNLLDLLRLASQILKCLAVVD